MDLNEAIDIGKSESLRAAVSRYAETIDSLYGHYLDSCAGFRCVADMIEGGQREAAKDIPGVDLDTLPFLMGTGDPSDPNNELLHQTTQGEAKARNRQDGMNHIRAAQWLVVLIYEYWDSEFRADIARSLSIESNSLQVDLFGDLRHLRQAVIHRQGEIRQDAVDRLKTIKGLRAGMILTLTAEHVATLDRRVKQPWMR